MFALHSTGSRARTTLLRPDRPPHDTGREDKPRVCIKDRQRLAARETRPEKKRSSLAALLAECEKSAPEIVPPKALAWLVIPLAILAPILEWLLWT